MRPLLVVALAAAPGCVRQVQHALLRDTASQRATIDAITLSDETSKPPVKIEDVPAEALDINPQKEEQQTLPSGEPVNLSLPDVRASTLANNFDLAVSVVDPAMARQQVGAEEWKFEATFSGTVTRNRVAQPPGNFSTTQAVSFGGISERVVDDLQAAVNLPLTTGGTVSLGKTLSRFESGSATSEIYDAATKLNVSQPLLRGAGFDIATAGVQVAKLNSGIIDAQTKLTAIQVLADVEQQYWIFYGSRLKLDVAQQQLDFAKEQLKNAQRRMNAAFSLNTKVDVARAETGLYQRVDSYFVARTAVRLQERELKRLMQRPDLPVDSPTSIIPQTTPDLVGLSFDRDKLMDKALANRMELLALELQLAADTVNINVQRNQIRPQLNLDLESWLLGTATSAPGARDQAARGDYHDWYAGISFDMPLAGNQTARALHRQAQMARARTAITQEQQKMLIRKQINDAVDVLEQNWLRILAARRSVVAAKQALEGEQRQYAEGLRTSDLVLQAAQRLAEAQVREIDAIVDYQNAKVGIAAATGTMLGYGRVMWAPLPPPNGPLQPEWNRQDGWLQNLPRS